MRRGPVRCALAVSAALASIAVLASCDTVTGSPSAPSDQVSAYRSELSATQAIRADSDAIAVCEQVIPTMAAMVGDYDRFIARLNATHDYQRLAGLDTLARETLASGGNRIRAELTENTPADLSRAIREFLTAGASLNNLIGTRATVGLNEVAKVWTRERQSTLALCKGYVPVASGAVPSTPASAPPSSPTPAVSPVPSATPAPAPR